MSNTKLNTAQRETLRAYRVAQPDTVIYHFPDIRVCVGIRRTGEHMGEFSVSICADTENKYRRKVGEYVVRERFTEGQVLPVWLLGSNYLCDTESEYLEIVALNIATAVSGT